MPAGVVLFFFLDDFGWVPDVPAAEAFMGPIIIPLQPSSKQFAETFSRQPALGEAPDTG
jgi:hypothetical protein